MGVHEARTSLLREQSDRTNLIESLWLYVAAGVKIPPGGVRWVESRRCFFAGALTLFEAVVIIVGPGAEATEVDFALVDRIAKELVRFVEELADGLG